MSSHPTGSVATEIEQAITGAITDAECDVNGGGGHYTIAVKSPAFEGKNMLASQRMVYAAIAHLMTGDNAPVHAVDKLETKTP